jgi:D-alanyl-D-alanine carboxypeptidase/D-alanyl-D-alanine-endopeptidase (penicillin-binding protein 4)
MKFNNAIGQKIILCLIALVHMNCSWSQDLIQKAIDAFAADYFLSNASIGFAVMDCQTGQLIASKNPSISLAPASTTKLFSTASAFELLGKEYAPKTRIYIEGKIGKDSVLNGNLWIRGAGDVSLGSRYYNADGSENQFLMQWADTLRSHGINQITGAIITDGSEFGYEGVPDGWGWSDIGNYYGSGASGLPIYDNMLRYFFTASSFNGGSTTFLGTFPEIPNLVYHNYITTGGMGDNSYIYGAPYSLDRFGIGTLEKSSHHFTVKGSLPDPEHQFAIEFSKALKSKGIRTTDSCINVRNLPFLAATTRYASKTLLFTHTGKSVNSIAWWTNMKSVNLFAEELLCWIGYQRTGNGSSESSLNQVMNFWEGRIDTKGLYLKDGSGLSRSNGISATHFCQLLKYMQGSKNFDAFYATLPIAGVSGTLSGVCKNQSGEGRIHAKSGTMTRIKSYAGYVETKSGKRLAFAFIINNFNCSSDAIVERMEKVLNAIANT